jgi:transcriptional regulator with PAS, ATPase and Fis domain
MKYGWRLSSIEKEGQALLQAYSWPGNLNQFRKVLNSAVSNLFRQPEITKIKTEWIKEAIENSDLQFRKKKPDAITIDGTLEEIERRIITRVLQECDMNLSRAAKRLGIGRSTLYRKIGMDVPK